MGSITALFVRKVLRVLDTECSTDAMLQSVGIEPDSEVDASQMIPAEEYYALLDRPAGIDAHPTTIPLRAGAAMRCEDYGAFGLAWKSASDLRGSYERAERYARVLTSVSTYEMEAVAGGALMHLHREGRRRLGLRLSNEATIASIAAISREVSTEIFTPVAVYFKHQAPESIAEHEVYFGCPVHFSSDKDALLVSDAALRTPNRVGDAGISRFFESHLDEEIARIEDHGTLDRRVPERQWQIYTAEQQRAFFAVKMPIAYRRVFLLMLHSGVRFNGAQKLVWKDVVLEGVEPYLRIWSESGRGLKTRRSHREIPINKDLHSVLLAMRTDQSPEDLVFTAPEGGRLSHNKVLECCHKVGAAAGIEEPTLHRWRHSFGTALAALGYPVQYIQKLMGHSSIEQTMEYIHIASRNLGHVVQGLEGAVPTSAPEDDD